MTGSASSLLRVGETSLDYLDEKGAICWSLPIKSIVLISEYTTNEGPYLDDYFLVFVTAENGKLYFSTCSSYSGGVDEALSILQQRLGSPIELALQGSTDWRSRVAWPVKMAKTEYFTFTPLPGETLTEKIKKKLVGPTYEYAISAAVQEYLKEQIRSRSR